ncbi:MAG: hypothetical protein ACK4GQ_06280 [Candidatus Hadarchaeales archaeon]
MVGLKSRLEELIELSKKFQKLSFREKLELMDEDIRALKKAYRNRSIGEICRMLDKARGRVH